MPAAIAINEVTVRKGENKEITLNIARLPTQTVIDLPIFVYRAADDGPTISVTAGLHGDEINGIETIRRMIYNESIIPHAGTVIAIPVVNVYGFIHTSRKFPDGKDLNRSFPGSSSGSLAGRIAHVLMNEVVPHIDCGIDFHTGGASKENYPHIRCNFDFPRSLELARAFSPPFVVNSKAPDHSFRKAAALQGKPILTFEGGESLRLHEFSIRQGIEGILRLMKHLGMKNSRVAGNETRVLPGSRWRRAQYSGLFRASVRIGDQIRRNQVLGYIADPFGETDYKIKAQTDGYVIGLNNMCVVNKGEALLHIAAEVGGK